MLIRRPAIVYLSKIYIMQDFSRHLNSDDGIPEQVRDDMMRRERYDVLLYYDGASRINHKKGWI